MNFEEALAHELQTVDALGGRVYPLNAPESPAKSDTPYAIFLSSEGLRTKTMEGYQSGKSVIGEINVVGKRYAEAKAAAGAVLDMLVTMQRRTIGADGPFIQEFTYEQPREFYEEKPDLYRCLIDFEVYF